MARGLSSLMAFSSLTAISRNKIITIPLEAWLAARRECAEAPKHPEPCNTIGTLPPTAAPIAEATAMPIAPASLGKSRDLGVSHSIPARQISAVSTSATKTDFLAEEVSARLTCRRNSKKRSQIETELVVACLEASTSLARELWALASAIVLWSWESRGGLGW